VCHVIPFLPAPVASCDLSVVLIILVFRSCYKFIYLFSFERHSTLCSQLLVIVSMKLVYSQKSYGNDERVNFLDPEGGSQNATVVVVVVVVTCNCCDEFSENP